ncbi:hypothetical protein ACIRSJ_19910 [Streptomyces virginiae]|uniref:hypothetical protein n=1 Tax=Streptomyces virginiae TaxID=1961 RepID=UPI00380158F5
MSTRAPLIRRVAVEALGTAALVTVVVGSGIQATGLTAPASVPPFLAAQLLGAAVGLGLVAVCFGRPAPPSAHGAAVPQQSTRPAEESALTP